VPKFPEPPTPAELAAIGADIQVLPAGTRIWRVYFQAGAHPTTWGQFRAWGPTDARFDHHVPPPRVQTREILYGAVGPKAAVTAIAEVFQASRVVEQARKAPTWVAFDCTGNLRLLDLTGTWPTRAGASMAITSGQRARARRWSQAIYAVFPAVDGLRYGSSMHGNEPCVALYERALRAMPARPVFHRLLSDPAVLTLLKNACADVNYALV
jgi:hypothetical protein